MYILYPPIKTYQQHRLDVDNVHSLYIEESGNPDGIPVVYLHSGPGLGSEKYQRRFFDPDIYRIIIFDQRGAGKSTPHAELSNNTTQDIVNDLEAIRKHLNIDKWILFGSAWGSMLALIYAIQHPQHVSGMVTHSVFLGRKSDIEWVYREGTNFTFPDYWDEFTAPLSSTEKQNVLKAYHDRLRSSDELTRMGSAKHWSSYQAHCKTLQPHNQTMDHLLDPKTAIALAHTETHYFINNCFIEDNYILDNIDKFKDIPGYIVHGRYDSICPIVHAWDLSKVWSASQLYIVRDAGHGDNEPGMIDALIRVSNKIAKIHDDPTAC